MVIFMELSMLNSCADPESFVRGGPTLTPIIFFFWFDEGKDRNTKIPLLAGHHPVSEELIFSYQSI